MGNEFYTAKRRLINATLIMNVLVFLLFLFLFSLSFFFFFTYLPYLEIPYIPLYIA